MYVSRYGEGEVVVPSIAIGGVGRGGVSGNGRGCPVRDRVRVGRRAEGLGLKGSWDFADEGERSPSHGWRLTVARVMSVAGMGAGGPQAACSQSSALWWYLARWWPGI
jgi:hypothetical protein